MLGQRFPLRTLVVSLLASFPTTWGISLDLTSDASVTSAISTIAWDLMNQYTGNQTGATPGLLPTNGPNGLPYYWWECGAMFGTMIDYWYYTGDSTYNDEVMTGMLWQATPEGTFNPANQSFDMGNDDQMFWAFSAMEAAEYNFPNPPKDDWQWLALAQSVYNQQVALWDTTTCGGGLHWQVSTLTAGYTYKNSIANGGLFQMGARLAKFTGNQTYADFASKVWDWMYEIKLISDTYDVYDGADDSNNCTLVQTPQWSYNAAILTYGAAILWNISDGQSAIWKTRTEGLIQAMSYFFPNGILTEVTCQYLTQGCNNDQQSFKAYVGRFLSATTRVAPWTYDLVEPLLSKSAIAAAASCTGGTSGTICGENWQNSTYDGVYGIPEQMDALEVIGAQLAYSKPGALTAKTGGTSKGDPGAGGNVKAALPGELTSKITLGDRVGAGILTALVSAGLIGGAVFISL